MQVTRRQFLQVMGMASVATMMTGMDFLIPEEVLAIENRLQSAVATPSICSYCSVGCGLLVHTDSSNNIVNIEGDPDHPISCGSLCSKGAASFQLWSNSRRITTPLYRAPGTNAWVAKDWSWTLDEIAKRIKATRDTGFIETENGIRVNRTESIASLGGAALDNEEAYLLSKFMRGVGVVYLEHQARI